jgi:FMN phosphatase YigB (HAD superfamily)
MPAEVVFVDDTPMNIQAAEAVGIQGITYTNLAEVARELDRVLQNS